MILNGELWVSRDVLSKYVLEDRDYYPSYDMKSIKRAEQKLTKREQEILAMVSVGARNDEIADSLCISRHTVKTHLYNVFKKIHVADRLQAALWAAKEL